MIFTHNFYIRLKQSVLENKTEFMENNTLKWMNKDE